MKKNSGSLYIDQQLKILNEVNTSNIQCTFWI